MTVEFGAVNWEEAASLLVDAGWARLAGVVPADVVDRLIEAAPRRWEPLPEVEMGVRQGGLSCGLALPEAQQLFERSSPR